MNRRSLRARLAVTFVGLAAVLIAGGYAGATWLLRRAIWEPLDAALKEEVSALDLLAKSDVDHPDGGVNPRFDDVPEAVRRIGGERDFGKTKFVAVVSPDGRVIATNGKPLAHVALESVPAQGEGLRYVQEGSGLYRVATHRIPQIGWAMISVRVDRQVRALNRASVALAVGAVAMLGAIGALAWSITARATREIDAITRELEALETDSVAGRVHERGTAEIAHLAEALNRLLSRLELAHRRLQRFTADAAHELRTPLAALRAHLDVALARPPSIKAYRDGLLDAIEQTERLAVLANDLLTLCAIESEEILHASRVDVGALAQEVAEFLEAAAREQHRDFSVVVDPETVVLGEAQLLKRLLLNLLGNAFVHTASGVAVQLEVRRRDDGVVIGVRDEGRGISDADKRVLFERFAPKRRANGSGLGLAICREIVARHRGTISIGSAPGRGTAVTVHLPAACS